MATKESYMLYIKEQMSEIEGFSFKKMFGEYGIYINGKIIGSICDNTYFLKITDALLNYENILKKAPPYDGAKDCYVIEQTDDKEFLQKVSMLTYEALPEPKIKIKR